MTVDGHAADAQSALQDALAAEHAAIFGYGIAGARLSGDRRDRALDAWNAHRAARDRLRDLIREAGASPTPAEPSYRLPGEVSDAASAARLATRLEERVAAAYVELVAAAETRLRHFAAAAARDCAVRAAQWRGSTVPFPGLPKRPGR